MAEKITYAVLCFLLLAFVPAAVAALKKRSFSRWYVYGAFLCPVAIIHALLLKKPFDCVEIYFADDKSPSGRKKKQYRILSQKQKSKAPTVTYMCVVFVSKLVFGAFTGLVLFALFRTFQSNTYELRASCVIFSIIFSMLLSAVELFGLSKMPMIADEITKRAFLIAAASVICSLPLYIIKVFVLDKFLPEYSAPWMFVCMCIAFAAFLWMLLSLQSYYYSVFYKFFDYCVLSIAGYVIFSAVTLICMSLGSISRLVYVTALPLQLFNTGYLAGIDYIENLSHIYSGAVVHLIIVTVLFVSGISCRNYKRKEIARRIEYRTQAFRISQRRVLRRHIPKAGGRHIKPINYV